MLLCFKKNKIHIFVKVTLVIYLSKIFISLYIALSKVFYNFLINLFFLLSLLYYDECIEYLHEYNNNIEQF